MTDETREQDRTALAVQIQQSGGKEDDVTMARMATCLIEQRSLGYAEGQASVASALRALEEEMRAYPQIQAEFHSGDREPGTIAFAVSRATVDRWADQLAALRR